MKMDHNTTRWLSFLACLALLSFGAPQPLPVTDTTHTSEGAHYAEDIVLGMDSVNSKDVHVVFMNHLDVGFDGIDPIEGSIKNVVNKYFTEYFPRAISIAKQLRGQGDGSRLIYTTHSWLVQLYLNCDPLLGLQCPIGTEIHDFEKAVKDGDITWHAFPFNAEVETMNKAMVEYGLDLTHSLDERFSVSRKTVLSQRDVPGTTRALLPVLASRNVTGLTFGVNGASAPPDTPPIFLWRDRASSVSIPTLYHPGGYGGVFDLDGFQHVLYFAFREDNQGPPESVDEVMNDLKTAQKAFPGARVFASTLDKYFEALNDAIDEGSVKLDIIEGEIGDSWVYGVASDPRKNVQMRIMTRCLNEYLLQTSESGINLGKEESAWLAEFQFYLLKGMEHTWGGDVKTFLDASHQTLYEQWSNEAFARIRNETAVKDLEATWVEQRLWAVDRAIQSLPNGHPLREKILGEFDTYQRTMNQVQQLPEVVMNATSHVTCGLSSLSFDADSKSLTSWQYGEKGNVVELLGEGALAEVIYETLDDEDYLSHLEEYMYCDFVNECIWAGLDFGKVNVSLAAPVSRRTVATVEEVRYDGQCQVTATLVFEGLVLKDVGAPAEVNVRYTLSPTHPQIDLDVVLVNKTVSRLPEVLFVRFRPGRQNGVNVRLNKLSSWIDARNDLQMTNSSVTHGVESLSVDSPGLCWHIDNRDTPVVTIGNAKPFDILTNERKVHDIINDGVSFNVYNNLWGTNYIMWYPYLSQDETILSRFSVIASTDCDE